MMLPAQVPASLLGSAPKVSKHLHAKDQLCTCTYACLPKLSSKTSWHKKSIVALQSRDLAAQGKDLE